MTEKKALALRRAVKAAVFILLLIGLLHGAYFLLRPREAVRLSKTRTEESLRVFDEPENSLDVLFLGHSGVYSAISPMELYREYGFTSYDCSQPLQMPWESARWLKGLLTEQSPSLVVFETDQLFYDKETTVARNSLEYALHETFPVLRNHANWKDWFGTKKRERSATKGYYYTTEVNAYKGNKKPEKTDRVYKIGKRQMNALEEVYAMCRQKGIRLMLLEVPSVILWDTSRYNAVRRYAEKRDLEFLDLNRRLEEMKFDWKSDTRDKGDHMNFSGARKVSAYVGKYIRERYELCDRREDAKYLTWKEDLARYEALTEGGRK